MQFYVEFSKNRFCTTTVKIRIPIKSQKNIHTLNSGV